MDHTDHKYLRIVVRCMAVVGLWPLHFQQKIFTHLYGFYFKAIRSCFCVFIVSQYMQAYHALGQGIAEVSDVISVIFLYSFDLVKIYVLKTEGAKKLIRDVYDTEKEILNGSSDVQILYEQNTKRSNFSCRLFITFGIVCCLQFCITPHLIAFFSESTVIHNMITNETYVYKERYLLFQSWYPFDKDRHYFVAYSWQVVNGIIGTTFSVCTDNLLFALTIYPVGQLKILKNSISNIGKHMQMTNWNQEVKRELVTCIVLHNSIIK